MVDHPGPALVLRARVVEQTLLERSHSKSKASESWTMKKMVMFDANVAWEECCYSLVPLVEHLTNDDDDGCGCSHYWY